MKFQLRDYQQKASNAAISHYRLKGGKNYLMVLPTGCHAKGSKILMYDGSMKNVEDIKVGDCLVGDDGKKRTVLELHRGIDKLYEIKPIKGNTFIVNGGHILSLYKTNEGKNHPSCMSRIDEISVEEYITKSNNYKHLHKLRRVKFVDFGNEEIKVFEPYFLGLYLGDGTSTNGISITSQRKEVEEYLYSFAAKHNVKVRKATKPDNLASSYCFSNIRVSRMTPNPIKLVLESLGLSGLTSAFKFIPMDYKTASESDRLELLAGLLDTDSYYDKDRNMYEYCTKSERLADDMAFLCRSLGFYCGDKSIKIVNGETYYRMTITGELDIIPTKVKIRKGKPRLQKKSVLVTGFSVHYIGNGEYYGFTIDGNHLYCDGQFFIHHNSGKSLIIADIAARLNEPLLVFQPNKEILEQNFAKLQTYGIFDAGCYSASVKRKDINRITFATIGSVYNHMEDFKHFRYILIDECHLVNPTEGMYADFFAAAERRIIGLTATPYRLCSTMNGSMLKFLTRTRPRVFSDVIYYCQVSELLARGFLTKLKYYDLTKIELVNVRRNSTGADFDEASLSKEFERVDLYGYLISMVRRLLAPKSGIPRRGILVFTRFVKEAEMLTHEIPDSAVVSGTTPKKERERILSDFKSGKIRVVANCGVLTTGFDYPELDTIVLCRPTMSLALYYQMIGRVIRPYPGKEGWVVDLCGNIKTFGKVEDLRIEQPEKGKWMIKTNGKQLTNVIL